MSAHSLPDRHFSRFRLVGVAVLLVAACGIVVLWAARRHALVQEAGARQEAESAGSRVRVVPAGLDSGEGTLTLQAEAQPYATVTLYAKVSGFLRKITVDKGSPVRQGQALAVVESTETDKDALALKADYDFKQRAAVRNRALAKVGAISAQAMEDSDAAAQIAREKLASQAALQGYQQIVAPFSGVVTQRFVDPGALIQNAGSTSTAQPILSLAQVDRLRVVLYLDQQIASRVKVGSVLAVRSPDRPGILRQARVARLAGAVDARTRTLLAEADLDNRDGAFLAGGAVQAELQVPARSGALRIPSEAVVLKEGRTLVVVVADQKAAFRSVVLGDDTGTRVQVLQGLQAGDRVVLSPPVTLKEGDRVQPVEVVEKAKS